MKITKGDKLGTVRIYADKEEVEKYDVYLKDDIKYKFFTTKNIILLSFSALIIVILYLFFRKKRKFK